MTTTTVTTRQLDQVLQDYKIRLTGAGEETEASAQEQQAAPVSNPTNWPTDRNRVPPYRPINRNLNLQERSFGSNVPETIFLTIMFSGVALNASIAKAWGATAGPFFPRVFRYAIGGEW
ncbi:hypothetical protein PVAG01_06253 [Phlyctema vagabunda]|uniref:Uncharacterized protein n=1 Tax=Phlyctema vagabunda TaxID=108571 RepID=A0ABR4PFI8_9HELO